MQIFKSLSCTLNIYCGELKKITVTTQTHVVLKASGGESTLYIFFLNFHFNSLFLAVVYTVSTE